MTVQFFGQYLVKQGIISFEQLEHCLNYQNSRKPKIGQLAIQENLLTKEQVKEILDIQTTSDFFGEIAVHKNYLSEEELDELLQIQTSCRVLLGEALIHNKILPYDQLKKHLKDFHLTEKKDNQIIVQSLITLPINLIYLTEQCTKVIQNAFFIMFNTPAKVTLFEYNKKQQFSYSSVIHSRTDTPYPFVYGLALDDSMMSLILKKFQKPEEFMDILKEHILNQVDSYSEDHDNFFYPSKCESFDTFNCNIDPTSSINVSMITPHGHFSILLLMNKPNPKTIIT